MNDFIEEQLPLKTRLNLETARITWPELGLFFARGQVIEVNAELDLVEAAAAISEDATARVQAWIANGQLQQLATERAKQWASDDKNLWAVVVAPWVLVQQR